MELCEPLVLAFFGGKTVPDIRSECVGGFDSSMARFCESVGVRVWIPRIPDVRNILLPLLCFAQRSAHQTVNSFSSCRKNAGVGRAVGFSVSPRD